MAADILGQLGEAFVLLRADGSQLDKDMQAQQEKLKKSITKMGDDLKLVGAGLSAGITAPILGFGAAAIQAQLQIDKAMDAIRVSTGKTGAELGALRKNFEHVFGNVPQDAEVVGQALGEIRTRTGQTGEGLEQLTTQLLNLSRVTSTDVNANVAASTRLFGDWSITTANQGKALDYVFKVSQQTGVGVTGLMEKLVQFGAPLRQFNFTFEESAALMGKWEKEGVNSELVLGSLRIAMAKFAEKGIDLKTGLNAVVGEIQRLGPSAAATNVAMEVFGRRAGPDMAAAILEGRFAMKDLQKDLAASTDSINQAASDTNDFAEHWKMSMHKLDTAIAPIGEKLLDLADKGIPALEAIATTVGEVLEWFNKLPGPVQGVGIAIAGIAAAAGPTIYVVGTLISNFTTIMGLFKTTTAVAGTLSSTMPAATTAVAATGTAATVTAGSLALMAVEIVAAVVAIYKIIEAGSLMYDLWKQSKQRSADAAQQLTQDQRNIQLAYEKTGIQLQNASDAERVLRAYSAGLRGEVVQGIDATSKQAAAWRKGTEDAKAHGQQLKTTTGHATEHAGAQTGLKKSTDAAGDAAQAAALKQLGLGQAHKKGKTDAEEYAEKLKNLTNALGGKDVTESAQLYLDAIGKIGTTTGLTKAETEQAAETLKAYLDKMRGLGQTTSKEFKEAETAYASLKAQLLQTDIDERIKKIETAFSGAELKANADAYIGYLQKIGTTTGLTGEETKQITDALEAYMARMQQLGQTTSEEFAKVRAARDQLLLPSSTPKFPGVNIYTDLPPLKGDKGTTQAKIVGEDWGKQIKDGLFAPFKDTTKFGKDIGDVMMRAFTGGGDVGKSVGGFVGNQLFGGLTKGLSGLVSSKLGGVFGSVVGGALNSVIPGLGTLLGSQLGDWIGKGLSKIASKIGGWFKGLFGGPSEKELAGRGLTKDFKSEAASRATEQQKAAAAAAAKTDAWKGNEAGALVNIVIGDEFMAQGHSMDEAMKLLGQLWAAEKNGPEATQKILDEINRVLGGQSALADILSASDQRKTWEEANYGRSTDGFSPKGDIDDLPQMARGGIGDFGPRGTLAVLHNREMVLPLPPGFNPASMAKGFDKSDLMEIVRNMAANKAQEITLAPVFNGTLANEMRAYMRDDLLPMMISILQDHAGLRAGFQTTLGVESNG